MNKKSFLNIPFIIFSILFSLMLILSSHITHVETDRSSLESIYMTDLITIDYALFILVALIVYLVFYFFNKISLKLSDKKPSICLFGEKRTGNCRIQFFISLFIILIAYTPYVLSHFPGGVYSDTMNSIWIVTGEQPFTTHEPPLYTLLWIICFAVTKVHALELFTIIQVVMFATLLASFINWNYRRGLKKVYVAIVTLVFAIIPIFPYYAISLWKDTVFGMIIFCYSWHLFCMMERINNIELVSTAEDGTVYCDISRKDIVIYILLSVLCVFGRNNGFYVMVFVSAVTVLASRKNRIVFKKLFISSIITIAICFTIQHPLFNALGFNVDTAIESMAIPLQQVGYIVNTDGAMSDEDVLVLAQMMPVDGVDEVLGILNTATGKDAAESADGPTSIALPQEFRDVLLMNWKSEYGPTNVDYIKFGYTFDRVYFDSHVSDFMKTYARMVIKNPGKAVKGYLLTTMGFWDVFEENGNAYICPDCIEWTKIEQRDIWKDIFEFSFDDIVRPKFYLSAAISVWVMLYMLAMVGSKCVNGYKVVNTGSTSESWKIVPFMPALGVWITIMLAVPLAFSFRYVFAVFFCIPIFMLCLAGLNK